MKAIIDTDELYPYYTISDDYELFGGKVVETSDERHAYLMKEQEELMPRFWALQKALADLYNAK